jgi:hypothetical protein
MAQPINPFANMNMEQCDVLKDLLTDYVSGNFDKVGYATRRGDIYLPVGVELLKAVMEYAPELFDQDNENDADRAIMSADLLSAKS